MAVYMILLAGVEGLFYHYTSESSMLMGVPVFRKERESDQDVVLNHLVPLKTRISSRSTLKTMLSDIKAVVSEVIEHQHTPYWSYVNQIQSEPAAGGKPLIPAIVGFEQVHRQEWITDSVYDLGFLFHQRQESLELEFIYDDSKYTSDSIQRLAAQFEQVLSAMLECPDLPLGDIRLLTDREQLMILQSFNQTAADYPREKSIHGLFEEQVSRTPQNIAVICGNQQLTYYELNARANRLARKLRQKEVMSDQVVGLLLQRSVAMPAAMLAVLKAGGAYCPIDPLFPEERILAILEDSGIKRVVGDPRMASLLPAEIELIDVDDEMLLQEDDSNPAVAHDSGSLAYVLYTSGSTGRPKGVMIEHRSVHNFLEGMRKNIPLPEAQRVLSVTTYSFDIFVLESLLPLTAGGSIILADNEELSDPKRLLDLMSRERAQLIQTTPSRMSLLLGASRPEAWSSVKWVLLGGEALPEQLVSRLRKVTDAKLYNMYGPTETTVWSTMADVTEEHAEIHIGRPIANTQVYIVGLENGQLQPIGLAGELCIAGDGLARGYWGRPELTAEKFVDNPFAPGERMYRTGDLAKWRPDGTIDFLGRIDHQVKIRGYRIELGDIEAQLLRVDGIHEAVAAAWEDATCQKALCVYYTGDRVYSQGELRTELTRTLPDYMLPSVFVHMEKLPLNSNGKVDRHALPTPNPSNDSEKCKEPQTPVERKVSDIWAKSLGMEQVGMLDRLSELGVNSLSLMRAILAIEEEFDFEFPVEDMAANRFVTISDVAQYVERWITVDV